MGEARDGKDCAPGVHAGAEAHDRFVTLAACDPLTGWVPRSCPDTRLIEVGSVVFHPSPEKRRRMGHPAIWVGEGCEEQLQISRLGRNQGDLVHRQKREDRSLLAQKINFNL